MTPETTISELKAWMLITGPLGGGGSCTSYMIGYSDRSDSWQLWRVVGGAWDYWTDFGTMSEVFTFLGRTF
jgi:hypothetical protein